MIEALQALDSYTSASLDSPIGDTTGTVSDSIGDVDAALEKIEYRQALRPILAELPDREHTILVLRFFHEMTQTQIAEAIGLSQMHVSRLLAKTLAAVRQRRRHRYAARRRAVTLAGRRHVRTSPERACLSQRARRRHGEPDRWRSGIEADRRSVGDRQWRRRTATAMVVAPTSRRPVGDTRRARTSWGTCAEVCARS